MIQVYLLSSVLLVTIVAKPVQMAPNVLLARPIITDSTTQPLSIALVWGDTMILEAKSANPAHILV